MKHVKLYEQVDDWENDPFGEELDNEADLAKELEYLLRTLPKDSDMDWDDFFDMFGLSKEHRSNFIIAAILNQKRKYEKMSDQEFFDQYAKN